MEKFCLCFVKFQHARRQLPVSSTPPCKLCFFCVFLFLNMDVIHAYKVLHCKYGHTKKSGL